MDKENKLQTVFSDDEFSKLPDEGTFFGAKEAPSAQALQEAPPPITDLASFMTAVKHGPKGGWMNAIKEEATKPLDPSAKAMVDSAKVMAAFSPQGVAESYIIPAAKALPSMAINAAKTYGKDIIKYGAAGLGVNAILKRIEGHAQ